jgi:hypothetical protein
MGEPGADNWVPVVLVVFQAGTKGNMFYSFTEEQISLLMAWMQKAISRRYGSAQYVTPAERVVRDKLSAYAEVVMTRDGDS